ncbi:hypothetical protein [Herbaspirillum sp. YR522]|uniref:hypothetical protein n=1 Tax=Herbaspirillum sp. YR522 TaxID=1144342 RepID=UPI0012FAC8BA|nr:hypothetical protein [Herbaspirillum sp. YR522]
MKKRGDCPMAIAARSRQQTRSTVLVTLLPGLHMLFVRTAARATMLLVGAAIALLLLRIVLVALLASLHVLLMRAAAGAATLLLVRCAIGLLLLLRAVLMALLAGLNVLFVAAASVTALILVCHFNAPIRMLGLPAPMLRRKAMMRQAP